MPNLGATSYGISQNQIANQSQGANAAFNQTLLRVPGFAQDSYGQLHVRGEHANLQFRINDVLLPEGIAGFGQELDTRFVDSLQVVTGSLPAQYGFSHGGHHRHPHQERRVQQRRRDSASTAAATTPTDPPLSWRARPASFSYFFTGDFLTSGIGIENPDGKDYPIHDHTEQYHGFGYMQYVIDNTSRLSLILSAYDADFQIPNNPGQAPAFGLAGVPTLPGSVTADQPFGLGQFASTHLDENQNEQNYYAVLAYQKSRRATSTSSSRSSCATVRILFRPDDAGDLIFNGVASREDRYTLTGGAELDASYHLTDSHTLRGGYVLLVQHASSQIGDERFPGRRHRRADQQRARAPLLNQHKTGEIYGVYLQDEWKCSRR